MIRRAVAVALDTLCVGAFALAGRRSHDEALDPAGWWHTAWPFLAGLALGWAVVLARRSEPSALVAGLTVWASTLVVGMLLRVASDQGTATPFVIVATLVLAGLLLGWRAVAGLARRVSA